ncbi:MAG: hypothetical protein AAF446_09680 [Pseudomonadota bacterium]
MLKIALAQWDFPVGRLGDNRDRILELAKQARDRHQADLIVFPDLAKSGWS